MVYVVMKAGSGKPWILEVDLPRLDPEEEIPEKPKNQKSPEPQRTLEECKKDKLLFAVTLAGLTGSFGGVGYFGFSAFEHKDPGIASIFGIVGLVGVYVGTVGFFAILNSIDCNKFPPAGPSGTFDFSSENKARITNPSSALHHRIFAELFDPVDALARGAIAAAVVLEEVAPRVIALMTKNPQLRLAMLQAGLMGLLMSPHERREFCRPSDFCGPI